MQMLLLENETWEDAPTKVWVSRCKTLNIYSQGVTKEESQRALGGAIRLWIHECERRGILETVLTQRGITPVERVFGGNEEEPLAQRPNGSYTSSVPIRNGEPTCRA